MTVEKCFFYKEQIDIMANLKETWHKKLDYIKSGEGDVLGAPVTHSKKDEDTIEDRQFKIRNLDGTFDEARQAFTRWKVAGKILKQS